MVMYRRILRREVFLLLLSSLSSTATGDVTLVKNSLINSVGIGRQIITNFCKPLHSNGFLKPLWSISNLGQRGTVQHTFYLSSPTQDNHYAYRLKPFIRKEPVYLKYILHSRSKNSANKPNSRIL